MGRSNGHSSGFSFTSSSGMGTFKYLPHAGQRKREAAVITTLAQMPFDRFWYKGKS